MYGSTVVTRNREMVLRSLEKSSVGTEFVDITGTGLPHHAVLVLDFRDQEERGMIRREKQWKR